MNKWKIERECVKGKSVRCRERKRATKRKIERERERERGGGGRDERVSDKYRSCKKCFLNMQRPSEKLFEGCDSKETKQVRLIR